MLIVHAHFEIALSHREEAIKQFTLAAKTTNEVDKPVIYKFTADLSDPAMFYLFEIWQDEAAFDRHVDAPHSKTFVDMLPSLEPVDISITRYQISSAAPVHLP